jgi:fibronectin type 3 domain-containing protein
MMGSVLRRINFFSFLIASLTVFLSATEIPRELYAQTLPAGLVAAYGFNEGSGSTTADSSGNANTGTISGATWTPSGRYGQALSFNGASSRVEINDANSLDLTTGMTIGAWVNPTTLSGWRTVILKEISGGLAYGLYAYDNAPRPAAYINTGSGELAALGTAGIPLNTWSHLAATYDGTTLRLFVNGSQVGSRAVSGAIRVSTNPLRIGGNAIWGEYFNGVIDEVRIYNRALSQLEIQTDMNTPLAAGTTDTTAPTTPGTLTATPISSAQVNLSWGASTDNVGVTGYQVERCQGTGCSNFALVTTVTGTTYNNTGLTASTNYSYRVRAADGANNFSGYSNTAGAATQASDTSPPTVPGTLTATPISSAQINLSWGASTDNVGVTGYQVERCQGTGCSSFALVTTVTGTTYNNTGLTASTSYSYRVRAADAVGNLSGYSNTAGAATQASDTSPPTVPGTLTATPISSAQVNLSWGASTDNVGVTGYQVERCQGTGCSSFALVTTVAGTTYNNAGLTASTSYSYRVRAADAVGNLSGYSNTASAATQASAGGPEPGGWYAGDMHVHRSCGGSPEAVSSLYTKMSPQNLAVISLLADMGNGEVQNPATDLPLVNGQDASVSTNGRIVHWDAEWHWDAVYNQYPHQALGGHIVALGLAGAQQIWAEYTYPIINWAHQQNAIAGFVHMQYLDNDIPQSLNCCIPIEYPVEVALGTADFIAEDVAGGDTAMQAYYRLLNTGFRPGFAAGTDYPCGVSELGSLLTYVQVAGGQMTYRNWIDGIKSGRTVISRNGHNEFLNLTVNGNAMPGDEINLTGAGSVPVTITWTANQNLSGKMELVHNGVVVTSQTTAVTSSSPATMTATVNFTTSGWLAARRMGSDGHVVHTGAVFVLVNNAPIRASVEDANFYVDWMDNLLTKTSPGGAWNSYFPTNLAAAQTRYQAAKAIYQQRATEAAGQPPALTITSTALPNGAQNMVYSVTLGAGGGKTPYSWSITSGSLPVGLVLNAGTGVISGTPTIIGSSSFTVKVTDSGAPVQTATMALSITILAAATDYTIWPSTTVPGTVDSGPDSAVELGVKFRSELAGTITGIRFYKASTNTGTHVGNLWSSAGTLLATATFANETASGWQQVNFTNPVTITANTVYVASYHTNVGHYSDNLNYFASQGVDNSPLHALANGVSGVNGVYRYGSSSAFPDLGWNSSNYWVDVVFRPAATLTSIAVTPANASIAAGVTQQFSATGMFSDGSTLNLTGSVTWASSVLGVAAISSAGLASGVSAGSTSISAMLNGVTGSTTLIVVGSSSSAITSVSPIDKATGVSTSTAITATFSGAMTSSTINTTTFTLRDSFDNLVPAMVTYNGANRTATLTPSFPLAASSRYLTTLLGGTSGVKDITGNPLSGDYAWSFSTAASDPTQGPGGPILIVSTGSNPFSHYYAEILRAEGFNAFAVMDLSTVTTPVLQQFDLVILGEMALTSGQVTMFSDWVNAGGSLIAMRPDKKLAGLLGLIDSGTTLSDGYLLVNAVAGPGAGIVDETMQFHGTADRYTLGTTSSVGTLYANATTATPHPAVTLRSVGAGQAAAFTYDLARSIVYTRQGNPAWSGQERDGQAPIRSDDLFYPDWVNLNKVAIPQADEQQRLLANLVIRMNEGKKPLPRFWYFPRGLEAVVIMTGDNHSHSDYAAARFDRFTSYSTPGCSVEGWECIRDTAYIYLDEILSPVDAAAYEAAGFEIALHVNTSCDNWTPSSLETNYNEQLADWSAIYPKLSAPATIRTHCIAWSDYATQPQVELNHGIGLDTNYYYWPSGWVNDRPGFFTGSGMPMRFATSTGSMIDVYQVVTQMTDESGQSYPDTIDTLLDRALGDEGYYGAFTANIHTDSSGITDADVIVDSAAARGVPVITARQMLEWLDGRNNSRIENLSWSGSVLSFALTVAQGGRGLEVMVPLTAGSRIGSVIRNGSAVSYSMRTVKGISYLVIPAMAGDYQVVFQP